MARRDHLVSVGATAFAARPYQDVEMADVARRAGVSRALLYRHFASKHDLFAAVYQAAAEDLLGASELVGDRPLEDEVRAGLEAHLRYFETHRHTVLAANRSLAGDPVIGAIISDELSVLRGRLMAVIAVDEADRTAVSTAVMSWLMFVHVFCVEWLANRAPARDVVRDVCVGALLGALASIDGPRPQGSDELR